MSYTEGRDKIACLVLDSLKLFCFLLLLFHLDVIYFPRVEQNTC